MNPRFIPVAAAAIIMAAPMAEADNFFDIEGGDATSVGVYVKELASGKVLVDHNSALALTLSLIHI